MNTEPQLAADEVILAARYVDLIAAERVVALSEGYTMERIIELGSSASLDRKPGSNWVEETEKATGKSLPPYIREVARGIEKAGHPLSRAIPMAISRIKRWSRGGDNVKADTRAKALKALAGWEALRAANKARMAKKKAS